MCSNPIWFDRSVIRPGPFISKYEWLRLLDIWTAQVSPTKCPFSGEQNSNYVYKTTLKRTELQNELLKLKHIAIII
jgi:hypothetical protein